MRELTDHKVSGLNEAIKIEVQDEPGLGGANHRYDLSGVDTNMNPSVRNPQGVRTSFNSTLILFQNGPMQSPNDANGISIEALIAITIDRLRGFQHGRKPNGEFDFATRGKYASKENACALAHLEESLVWLQKRTLDRVKRGVEGSLKV
jgi:hypothetical protein